MSSPIVSREWHLVARPHGRPALADFALREGEVAPPGSGQILVRNSFLSVDPYMRRRMDDVESYVPPFQLDRPMDGAAVGVVVASERLRLEGMIAADHQDLREGYLAMATGWIADGRLRCRETVADGLASTVQAFLDMLDGGNTGKMLVRLEE